MNVDSGQEARVTHKIFQDDLEKAGFGEIRKGLANLPRHFEYENFGLSSTSSYKLSEHRNKLTRL